MSGKLNYNFLGSSGLKVSNLCLGCMTFGTKTDGPVQCNEEESHKILDRFQEWGGNFIDTANVYQSGKAEEIVGSWLSKQERDKIVLATKVRGNMSDDPNGMGLSRFHIMAEIHIWDSGVPIEETLSALNDLVRCGKVRYVGASNLTGWQLQKIVDLCRERGWDKWISLQQQYNLLCRQTELELVDVCRNEGVGLMPWSPLKGGWLTGKIKKDGQQESGSRVAWASAEAGRGNQAFPSFDEFNNEKTWKLLDLMENIGKKYEKTVAQVALRWLIQKDFVSSVVIGVKTVKQLDDNLGASSGWELTKEEMVALNDASMYDVPYPYEMVWRINKDRQRQHYDY